jgi:hypothetical protein
VGDGRDPNVGIGNPVEDDERETPEAALPMWAILPPKWPALRRLTDLRECPVDLFDERDFQSRMFVSVPGDGARDLRFGSRANVEAGSATTWRGAAQDTSADQRPFFIRRRLTVVVRIAPIQLGQPGRFPTRIGRAIQSGQHSGHNIQPITLGELEHVPEEILCCAGHDH